MYIYRIEHKDDGIGPYFRDAYIRNDDGICINEAHMNNTHPSMWQEHSKNSVIYSSMRYKCAFDTVEKLVTWFDGWLTILDENDFIVAIYSVSGDNVHIGEYQTIFCKGALIERISIKDFLAML